MDNLARAQHKQNLSLFLIGFFLMTLSSCLLLPSCPHPLRPMRWKWKAFGNAVFLVPLFPREIRTFIASLARNPSKYLAICRLPLFFPPLLPYQNPGSFEKERVFPKIVCCLFSLQLIKRPHPTNSPVLEFAILNEIIVPFSLVFSYSHVQYPGTPENSLSQTQGQGGSASRRACLSIVIGIFIAMRGSWLHIVHVMLSADQGCPTMLVEDLDLVGLMFNRPVTPPATKKLCVPRPIKSIKISFESLLKDFLKTSG